MGTPLTLKVFRGDELVRSEQFNREIIKIGRLASAHLVLDDDKISRIHSVIEVAPDGAISIIDMGSAEGTFVNGKKVSRGALRFGDHIRLGGLEIVLEAADAAGAAPAPVANHVAPHPAPAVNRAVAAAAAFSRRRNAPRPAAPIAPEPRGDSRSTLCRSMIVPPKSPPRASRILGMSWAPSLMKTSPSPIQTASLNSCRIALSGAVAW